MTRLLITATAAVLMTTGASAQTVSRDWVRTFISSGNWSDSINYMGRMQGECGAGRGVTSYVARPFSADCLEQINNTAVSMQRTVQWIDKNPPPRCAAPTALQVRNALHKAFRGLWNLTGSRPTNEDMERATEGLNDLQPTSMAMLDASQACRE